MAAELGVSFVDVGWLVFFAALASILAARFGVPPVLALLGAGVLIGPHALGLITENQVVSFFAEIGAVLLLFTIGAEFSLSKLRQYGAKAFSIGLIKLAVVFWLSYQTARLLSLDGLTSLYVAAILAITSTALTIKILEGHQLASREEVPYLVASLVVEDIFAIFALVFFSTSDQAGATALGLATSILVALAVLSVAYFVVLRLLGKLMEWLDQYSVQETTLFLGLTLAIGFSFLAQSVGLTASIGAFLAGSVVASLPKGKALEHALAPFALVFSAIFFVSIGLNVNLQSVLDHGVLVIIFGGLGALYRFLGTGMSMYLNGFSSKSAAFSGLAMMAAGEFSLVIASQGAKVVSGFDLVSVTSAVVFLSTLLVSVSVPHHAAAYRIGKNVVPQFMQKSARRTAVGLTMILNAFSQLPYTAREQLQKFKVDAAVVSIVISATAALLWIFGEGTVSLLGNVVPWYAVILSISTLVLLPILFRIGQELFFVLSYVERKTRAASAMNWTALVILAGLLLLIPFALTYWQRELGIGDIALLVLVLVGGFYAFNLKTSNREANSVFLSDDRWNGKKK
ncbi:cation:proton antiporter [Candidatus Micrarchaeota archaeon]|nr:cation:proton antiporter [Candidatus Micrarchaeota archaeon]